MVDPLACLPHETALHLLLFLDPYTLTHLGAVSHCWLRLTSDAQLWRRLAVQLGYCDDYAAPTAAAVTQAAGTLQVAQPPAETEAGLQAQFDRTIAKYRQSSVTRAFDDCTSFRQLCCLLWRLECHWTGRDVVKSDITAYGKPRAAPDKAVITPIQRHLRPVLPDDTVPSVWRLKLDPVEKTIINTATEGGVTVSDAETLEVLWHLPREMTRQYPHLEFSCGYMVFDRIDLDHFEVWKSERIAVEDETHGIPPKRGQYRPHARLSSPRAIRAYRFQFPVLAAATRDGAVLLWNVPDKTLFQTIDITDSAHGSGNINYIDFDDEYVFLIGDGAKNVTVYSRATSEKVWDLGGHFEQGHAGPATWQAVSDAELNDGGEEQFVRMSWKPMPPGAWQTCSNRMNAAQVYMKPYQTWSAIHPDVKTNTLLVVGQGSMLLLRDYKKFFCDPSKKPEAFEELIFRDVLYGIVKRQEAMDIFLAWDALAWNSRRDVWDASPTSLLAVHDGKACVVNLEPVFIDLERPGPVVPADTRGPRASICDTTAAVPAPERGPCCTIFMSSAGFRRPEFHNGTRSLLFCSCLQMDGTAAFCVDMDEENEPFIRSFDFSRMETTQLSSPSRRRQSERAMAGSLLSEDDEVAEWLDAGHDEDGEDEYESGSGSEGDDDGIEHTASEGDEEVPNGRV